MLDKYGVETNSQRECVKTHMSQLASKRQVNSHTLTLLDNYDWLASEYQIKKRSASDIADQLGIDYSTLLRRIANYQWSVRQVYNKSLCENQI
jgi:DNA-binding NtrC family response regulator